MAAPRRRAFTLVELLVVVGILAVLVALLMPALGRARRQAESVVCLGHLRQFVVAYHAYVMEHKGKAPLADTEAPVLLRLMSTPGSEQHQPVPLCPEATGLSTREMQFGAATILIGSAHEAWGLKSPDPASAQPQWPWPAGASYGINRWAFSVSHRLLPNGCVACMGYAIEPGTTGRDRVPLFADAAWEYAYPFESDRVPKNLISSDITEDPSRGFGMRTFCIARHGRAVNIGFLDGHAATTPLDDLWKLKWHSQWSPTDVALPRR